MRFERGQPRRSAGAKRLANGAPTDQSALEGDQRTDAIGAGAVEQGWTIGRRPVQLPRESRGGLGCHILWAGNRKRDVAHSESSYLLLLVESERLIGGAQVDDGPDPGSSVHRKVRGGGLAAGVQTWREGTGKRHCDLL